jgi:hypothetical protein
MIQPGEQLQPPDAATLRDVAQCYAEQAQLLEQQQQQRAKQQQKGSSSDGMDVDGSDVEDEVSMVTPRSVTSMRQAQHTHRCLAVCIVCRNAPVCSSRTCAGVLAVHGFLNTCCSRCSSVRQAARRDMVPAWTDAHSCAAGLSCCCEALQSEVLIGASTPQLHV